MLDSFIKRSKCYLITFALLLIVFILIRNFLGDIVLNIDLSFKSFINEHVVKESITPVFKILTHLGSAVFLIGSAVLTLLFIKDKNYFINVSLNLSIVYVLSVIFKNFIKRERPLDSLIPIPSDYSFPSGHTMCSVAFYGFLIYLVNKHVKNKILKVMLNVLFVLSIVLVAFSRLYLGVHYLSDVIIGALLGILSLLMYINYVKKEDII